MKKNIKSFVLMLLLGVSPILAKSSTFDKDTYSLIGIEAGYNSFNIDAINNNGTSAFDKKIGFPHAGIKMGAQSKDYRLFLSSRYNKISNFDYAYMIGLEIQYLINFSKETNLFLGLNIGKAEMKYIDKQKFVRTISDSYIGGDIGINYHLDETMDLEFGLRLMQINTKNLKNDISYTFDTIMTTYMSIIFKF